MTVSGAAYHKGKSKQDYRTPAELLSAFTSRWGVIEWDLAAATENAVAEQFLTERDNSLSVDWSKLPSDRHHWLWLNPPFGKLAPWASKCEKTSALHGTKIALLVPASVGANWWLDTVHKCARVLILRGRISFDGKSPFPKDCALCLYGLTPDYVEWDWRQDVKR